ncbi:MAG: hypothetical protein XD95_0420 [Microgenomates bacterium 39_7]|nr:MAG: hypothetical protein XD95_0420 [Microgenomates bacterium 39_7]
MTLKKIKCHYVFYFLLALIFTFNLLDPIRLTVVDLGRHIANGRELISGQTQVLFQNHYSYSMPEQRFVNHHWFFGVIVYLLEQTLGLAGTQLFNILVLLITLILVLKMMEESSNPLISSSLGLIAVLFLSMRSEIRPESVGLLFASHTLWQLRQAMRNDRLSNWLISLLVMQQLFWVNTHISFVFGIFLIGLAWASTTIMKSPESSASTQKKLGLLLIFSIIVSLLNPNFIQGFLEPFNILVDYGYSIVENQTLLFLWTAINHSSFIWFVALNLIFLPLFILNFNGLSWFERILAPIGLVLGYQALRNVPLMVIFVMPTLAKLVWIQSKKLSSKISFDFSPKLIKIFVAQLYALFILLVLTGTIDPSVTFTNRKLGAVVEEAQAAQFIKNHPNSGPIFNNYDLGSYLIYHLYPEHRVFVDNRPEAYGSDFFKKTYIPMQQDSQTWESISTQYNFKMIVFGVRDITPWAKQFMTSMSHNSDWSNVYEDQFVIIWVKNSN